MSLQLGQTVPDFTAETSHGSIRFHDWLAGKWAVFFSHPKDFTPVCTTELGEAARLAPDFAARDTQLIGLSVDTLERHAGWEADIADTQGSRVNFPMIADTDRSIATLYGMIHPEADPAVTVRALYIIDPAKKLRLSLTYPPSTGRNFQEVLRVLDSLQLTDRHKVATPVNWQPGQRAIILPSLSDDDARARFPQGWKAVRPYLRYVAVA
jgi:alkyl hydroperoxide reductase subunit AhpC